MGEKFFYKTYKVHTESEWTPHQEGKKKRSVTTKDSMLFLYKYDTENEEKKVLNMFINIKLSFICLLYSVWNLYVLKVEWV